MIMDTQMEGSLVTAQGQRYYDRTRGGTLRRLPLRAKYNTGNVLA